MFSFTKKEKESMKEAEVKWADSPVSEGLIIVCEKCGKKIAKGEENPARELQQTLKEKIRANDGKGKWRAVITGCLDICPDDSIAVGIVSSTGKTPQFFTVAGDKENVSTAILEKTK